MRAFIDTNVVLDVLLGREEFLEDSQSIWSLCEAGRLHGHVSAISFNNAHYIINQSLGRAKADKAMRTILDTFETVSLDSMILNRAVDAGFKDFEDAIQYFSSLHAEADYFITRNVGDFPKEDIPIMTPAAFLALDLDFN